MIAHLSYVMCDKCGDPAHPADDAKEARAYARRVGFARVDGRDLCKRCNLSLLRDNRHDPAPSEPEEGV